MCKRTDCLLPSELDRAVERQLLADGGRRLFKWVSRFGRHRR
ncbi:hypothetical protein [Variovorax gossypii]